MEQKENKLCIVTAKEAEDTKKAEADRRLKAVAPLPDSDDPRAEQNRKNKYGRVTFGNTVTRNKLKDRLSEKVVSLLSAKSDALNVNEIKDELLKNHSHNEFDANYLHYTLSIRLSELSKRKELYRHKNKGSRASYSAVGAKIEPVRDADTIKKEIADHKKSATIKANAKAECLKLLKMLKPGELAEIQMEIGQIMFDQYAQIKAEYSVKKEKVDKVLSGLKEIAAMGL